MSCPNCFNGCTDITSDKCIRYTGPTIELLNINNGDTLLTVENAILTHLLSALDGTGIIPFIDSNSLCTLIENYLPSSGEINLIHVIDALIKSICDLNSQIISLTNSVNVIEADYTIDCLSGVTANAGTHNILQATIDKLCSLETNLAALVLDLETNYVSVTNINSYIENYLETIGESDSIKTKMIPYVAMEYYGPLTGKFDSTGAGIGDWIDVYLCNGDNGTPDKRGRVGVGATNVPGLVPMDSAVNPGGLNPTYTVTSPAVSTKAGTNSVVLTETQIPSHTHTGTTDTEPSHTHNELTYKGSAKDNGDPGIYIVSANGEPIGNQVNDATTGPAGEHEHGFTTDATGGDTAHTNTQPSLACYYIIYLP